MRRATLTRTGLIAATALTLGACARTIEAPAAAALGRMVAVVDDQAATGFAAANQLTRRVAVDRFVRSGDGDLAEDKLGVVVTRESAAAWGEVFSILERYAAQLATLTDRSRGAATATAMGGLVTELNDGAVGANISPGIGAVLGSFGDALVTARAQRDARRIAAATDPAFQATVRAMADAIGADDRKALRATVWGAWTTAIAATRQTYRDAAGARNEPRQRALIAVYIAQLAQRDAQLRTMADLRASLLALGAAHAALADGRPRAIGPLLDAVTDRLARSRALYDTLKPAS